MKREKSYIEYKLITNFVEKKYRSQNTINNYKRHLNKFFKWLDMTPEKYLAREGNGKDYQKEIEDYHEELYKANVPPKSRKVGLSAIKVFMIYNLPDYDARLPPSFWFKLSHGQFKGSGAVVNDRVPTIEILRKILMGASLKSKALFMTLATSGMRVGEALSLTWDDIDLTKTPALVKIKAESTKTQQKRFVFISPEARDVLIEWKEGQKDYIKQRKRTGEGFKTYHADKVFSYTYQNACEMWWTLLKNSNNKEMDHNRYIYHIHSLRKVFRSRLAKVLAPDYIEFLMGHHTPRTKEYLDLPVEELAEEYMKGVERLLIFQTPADTTDLRETVKQLKDDNQDLRKDMEKLMRKLAILTE